MNGNSENKKRILIIGEDSYVGENAAEYLRELGGYEVALIDARGLKCTPEIFKGYDVVLNVAGIAHVKETRKNRELFYKVNRDLASEAADAAKSAGVGQFITMSSMSVYGRTSGVIGRDTVPKPTGAYGVSKLQADEHILSLASEDFKPVCLRPPMIYGKGCKGNYQRIRSFTLKFPVFPKYRNERSVIYIGNLCEFIRIVIEEEREGVFIPQNAEYINTSELVGLIAEANGKKMRFTGIFNPAISLLKIGIVKKVFGTLTYEKLDTVDKYSLRESVFLTEKQ